MIKKIILIIILSLGLIDCHAFWRKLAMTVEKKIKMKIFINKLIKEKNND